MSFDESPLGQLSSSDVDLAALRRSFANGRRVSVKDLKTLRLVTSTNSTANYCRAERAPLLVLYSDRHMVERST